MKYFINNNGPRERAMRSGKFIVACFALCGLAAPLTGQALAQNNEFNAKQMRLIIGFGVGGGYDQYGRVVARFMEKHLPGNPTIVPQNMPGAGSISAGNAIYANSPKDGSVFGIIARDAVTQPLVSDQTGAKYDATKISWIGSPAAETNICIATSKAKVATYNDLLKNELIIGGTGAGTGTEIYPKALNGLVGTKFKVIGGYPSSTDVFLAMERDEVHGICESYSSVMRKDAEAIAKGEIKILFQASLKSNPQVKAPFLLDMIKDPEQRKALEFVYAGQVIGRPFIAPPDLPPAILKTLRGAFDATMKDPEFLKEAEKQKLDIDPVSGAELEKVVRDVYATPKPIIELVKKVSDTK
jgi:tripartite-type tricarboxylate transporter receptor subunit TctC